MKFKDLLFIYGSRFALGAEETRGDFYLSIPVSNPYVDYEEYFRIDRDTFESFKADPALGRAFAQRCRLRELDHLLIVKPGTLRGTPI